MTGDPHDEQGQQRGQTRHDTILLDVDGTLVDSTYHHALAWHRAFRRHDIPLPMWRVHRSIGMGGDRLVGALAGDEVEQSIGDDLRAAWYEEYAKLVDEVEPLPGAAELVRALSRRFTVALGSSGKPEFTRQAVDLVGIRDDVAVVTTSEDAPSSKPAPDILEIALQKSGGRSAIVIGDSTFDVASAARMGAPCVAIRTGGFGPDELRDAGAVLVTRGLPDLLDADWDGLALMQPPPGASEDPPLP
ncbi:MAG: HAD family hydrolase [Intrasporangium sp.]|uniref:HAD family hydrolase n=1 Tax=Intrasporangium sp. TaxID=1925024 RepID=UPI003F81BA9C